MPDDKPVSRIRERTGIHVYSDEKPDIPGVDFRSFSDGWYTFTGTAAQGKGRRTLPKLPGGARQDKREGRPGKGGASETDIL